MSMPQPSQVPQYGPPGVPLAPPPAKKSWFARHKITTGLGAIIVVLALGSALTPHAAPTSSSALPATAPSTSKAAPATTSSAPSAPAAVPSAPAVPPASTLTAQQQLAADSATSYLSLKGFSRQGLIDQLSSEYGDKYAVKDATAAVDSLTADWNEQATRSATSYLSLKSFSCAGLIDQLSSQYGDKFTKAQATYGAHHTKACG